MPMFARRFRFQMTEEETGGGGGPSLPAASGAPGEEGAGIAIDAGGEGTPSVNEWDNLPRSWTRDMEVHWKAAPSELRQFAHRREQDYDRGVSLYRGRAENYDKLHGVFKDVLADNPNLDVPGVYQTLAGNHMALMQAQGEERKALFLQLAKSYGVDFANAAAANPDGQPADGLTAKQRAEIAELLNPVVGVLKTHEEARKTQELADASKVVDAFFSDAKNKYVKEVGPLMAQIVQSGVSKDLGEAYELAVMRTPAVKAKYLADLAAAGSPAPGGTGGPRNVKSTTEGAPPPSGRTMDDDMNAIAKKHYPDFSPRSH